MLAEQFTAATASARTLAQLDNVARLAWRAWAEGCLSDEAAQGAAEAVEARKASIKGRAALSLPKPSSARRRPVSPDRKASIQRRRAVAASGAVPSFLACKFTPGETAALSIVAQECRRRGRCQLHIDAIAAKAGTCRSIVQSALRQAGRLGLVAVTERRHAGRKSDTNIVAIVSAEWRAWLKLGGNRVQKKTHHGNQESSYPHSLVEFWGRSLSVQASVGHSRSRPPCQTPKRSQSRQLPNGSA